MLWPQERKSGLQYVDWVGRWCWVAYSVWASYCFGFLVWQGPAVLAFFHLHCLPFSFPFFRGHGLAWLQCCRQGRWLGCKIPNFDKLTNERRNKQTNCHTIKALIIHALKWKIIFLMKWPGFFFRWGREKYSNGREAGGGRGGGKRG